MTRRAKQTLAALFASGVLIFSAGQIGGGAAQEVNVWHHDANAIAAEGGHRIDTAQVPQPPESSVLKEASIEGYAWGLGLEEAAQQLGQDVSEGSGADLDEVLESIHEGICLAFISYLERGDAPENPAEMEERIELYIAGRPVPPDDLRQARRELEYLYKMARELRSIGKLQAEVADGVLCS